MPDTPTFTGAPWTTESGAIVFLPDTRDGFTEEEIYTLFSDTAVLTAAADAHDGAMIAFAPTTEDVVELALPSGVPIAELHTTVIYLGIADDITPDQREMIHTVIADIASRQPVIIANLFGFSVWNPAGPEPCVVADVQGADLEDAFDSVQSVLDDVEFEYPDQHLPWRPHITLLYGATEIPEELLAQTGPISYDRIRVAFGGVVTDYPLMSSG